MNPSRAQAQVVRLSELRKMRECKQVAAVCYRIHRGAVEFLLVRTRGSRRWTFPKGNAEPGLTHAQAAALEAFEEAGVHGRIEEASFIHYFRRSRSAANAAGSAAKDREVSAHLCQVFRLCAPKEANRDRTWFSIEEAKRHLREGRKREDGNEFVRVVDKAVSQIQRSRQPAPPRLTPHPRWDPLQFDALQRVQFEAPNRFPNPATTPAVIRRDFVESRISGPVDKSANLKALRGEILSFSAGTKLPPAGKKAKSSRTGSR